MPPLHLQGCTVMVDGISYNRNGHTTRTPTHQDSLMHPALPQIQPVNLNTRHPGPMAPGNTIELPPRLPWPEYELDTPWRAMLDALAPNLAQIPLPFIQEQISLRLEQMMAGLRNTRVPSTISRPRAHSITVPIPRDTGHTAPMYPTHILTVSLPSTGNSDVALIPIHGIVFAANCAAQILHPLPDAVVTPGSLVLPLCPVVLPSVQAAFLLRAYMYTHRADTLLNALLALPGPLTKAAVDAALGIVRARGSTSAQRACIDRIAAQLASARPTPGQLLAYAARVRELWQTVCWLGMHDGRLWSVLDLAWELALLALKFVAEVQSRLVAADVQTTGCEWSKYAS
ncbi:hypothetical protein C8R43DRAFT_1004820 [Mycena crocata]|nr:hypothetical protein C8R43DRAFT_1004820 [Mycena crocata]